MGDGNFKQDHLRMRNPEADVYLSNGHGYMVKDEDYQKHLKVAVHSQQVHDVYSF